MATVLSSFPLKRNFAGRRSLLALAIGVNIFLFGLIRPRCSRRDGAIRYQTDSYLFVGHPWPRCRIDITDANSLANGLKLSRLQFVVCWT